MHLNSEEMEAFLKGKPVSKDFIAHLENRTKALVQKFEVITKDLSRPGDDLLQTDQSMRIKTNHDTSN
jgi:hypothetical protein